MENLQHEADNGERRLMSRINAALRTNYQLITRTDALKDPYDPSFVLPRYFLLLAELDEIDSVHQQVATGLEQENPTLARIIKLMNQKLDLITGALYDAMVETMLPSPTRVNISESGLSFYARDRIPPGSHVHLTLSHPENAFHLATTARVVYSEDEDLEGFRTGAYFISLHPNDRAKLAHSISHKLSAEDERAQFGAMGDF